jgi:hypothetical protein
VTVGRYVEGVLLFVVALGPLHTATYLWRSKLLPAWKGAQARLAEIIVDVTVVVCVCEVLGSVHLYRLAPVVIALALVGLGGIWGATQFRSGPPDHAEVAPRVQTTTSAPRIANAAALVAVSVVLAEWSTRTVAAYRHGMYSVDTLWYHMPLAARFAQDGSITALHYTDAQADTVFYPASSELLHSFGIVLMGNDVLSPLLNSLWLGLALLASWCIGKRFGVAPITLTGSAILFATPGLVATQPGGAYDDIVGVALLLSSVALLLNAQELSLRSTRVAWVLAAAAAGLAIGTKYTFIGPVVALTAGIGFLAPRGRRVPSVGLWLLVLLLVGGFWYGRNFVAVGNPIPTLHLKLGPISLPSTHLTTPTSTFAQFMFDSRWWHQYFIPGLRLSFGPAWWALLGLSLLGLVLAVITGERFQRILGAVGLVSGVIFLVTPQFLAILGVPVYFVDNVRYNDAAVVLGLVLLPINPMLSAWRRARWVLLAYGAILVATQFDASIWPTTFFSQKFFPPVRGSDSLLGLILGVALLAIGAAVGLSRSEPRRWRVSAPAWIVLSVVVVIVGFPLQQMYLRDRYVTKTASFVAPVYSWFQDVNNARVGVAGPLAYLQYPFYGRSLTNHVQYLGVRGSHGAWSELSSCQEWQTAIREGHYSYIIVTNWAQNTKQAPSAEMKWIEASGDAKLILQGTGYALYELGPHFSSESSKSCSTVA